MNIPHEYATACELIGLPRPRGILNGLPHFTVVLSGPEQDLADKLWAAMGKPASDPDVIILRDTLGSGSPEWLALVDYRKEIVEKQRGDRYAGRVLGLVVDFLFSVCTVENINGYDVLVVDIAALNKIKTLRDQIESEVPY